MVVVNGPERREVARLHGGEEVLPPATLQVHEAPQALLGLGSHHLQAVRHVRLVKNPSEERGAVRRSAASIKCTRCTLKTEFR